jgi:hypothetical protein
VRLSATQQRSASQVAGEAFDIFITASGYEQRAVHCMRKFPVNRIPKRVAFGFNDRITQQREDNDREFSRAAVPVMLSSGDSGDVLREWVSEALEEFTGKPTRVLVDYSSMTRTWYAAILEAFLIAEVNSSIECVFSYSVAEYSAPSYYSSNASVGPIPNFCSLSAPDKPSALIIGLGYEQERALGLVEYIDPAYTCAFYTDPALDQRFRDAVLQNNQAFLSKLPRERLYPYPLADLQRTGDMLNSVCRALLDEHRVILAPLGMKPFSLLCLLLATKLPEADVWRVTPGTKAAPIDRRAAGPILALAATFDREATKIEVGPHSSESR